MKNKRQEKILELIKNEPVFTQDDLQNKLNKCGYNVTQSTVSRDIRELKLVKGHDKNGNYCYVVNGMMGNIDMTNYTQMISSATLSVDYALNNVVVKCRSGMAQSVCVAIDSAFPHMMIGTIAGDDTVLAITKSTEDSENLAKKINEMI